MRRPKEILEDRIEAVEEAVYRLSEGPYCRATNQMIADAAGLRSAVAASECLRVLRERGILKLYDWRDGISIRYHLILSHPQAEEAMANHYCTVANPRPFLRVVGL